MTTSNAASSNLQPLAAPPLITAPVRIMIPSSSLSLLEPSLVTPRAPELYDESSGDLNICGDNEKIGRWSEQEHLVFLEGLKNYGKQWKTIAGMIGTRTVVQVRTHAQKYFQKMDRSSGEVEFIVPSKVKPAGRSQIKRKSLPSSSPSRKKSRKFSPRLSLGTKSSELPAEKSLELVYQAPSTETASFPSYISKSSSSHGSENWSTISPNTVVNLLDLHNPLSHNEEEGFDLLGEDPLEWLIETDTQQYLPESSLPLFPFLDEDKMAYAANEEDYSLYLSSAKEPEPDMVEDALLLNMVDPNVTMQSLFLPSDDMLQ